MGLEKRDKSRVKTIIGIISISFALSLNSAISPLLANIKEAFPSASTAEIQVVYTIIQLGSIPVLLLGGWLSSYISKKIIAFASLCMLLLGSIVGFFGYKSLGLLYAASALIGSGMSLGQTMLFAIIADLYDDEGRATIGGMGGALFSITGVLYSSGSGWVADSYGWRYSYLLGLLTILWLVLLAFYLPPLKVPPKSGEKDGGFISAVTPRYVFYVFLGVLYTVSYNAFNTTVSSLVVERELGSTQTASTVLSFCLFAGIPAGFMCGRLFRLVRDYFMTVALSLLALGLFTCALSTSVALLCLGGFLVGFGNGLRVPGNTVVIGEMFDSRTNALGIALYNALGSLGGFLSPYIFKLFYSEGESGVATKCLLVGAALALVAVIGHVVDGALLAPRSRKRKNT